MRFYFLFTAILAFVLLLLGIFCEVGIETKVLLVATGGVILVFVAQKLTKKEKE